MRAAKRGIVWAGLLAAWQAAIPLEAATQIKARLLAPISSYWSKTGDPIEALVVPSPCGQANSTLPAGTVLTGRVGKLHRVGLGILHETAGLHLNFDEVRLPDGSSYHVETRLVGIDNARERIDKKGGIHGIRATDSISSRLASRLALGAWDHPFLVGPVLLAESSFFYFPDPEINYERGTELALSIQMPELSRRPEACPVEDEASAAASQEIRQIVEDLPYWSYSKRQPQPMDLVNLVFIGSRSELELAFNAAGWSGALRNSMSSGFHAVRAIAEDREYAEAPMRTLLLHGEEPDLSLQDSVNTFQKRDHLRIWKQTEEWQDRTVWASSATRDLGATFSFGHPFGFTHQIEGNVDRERDKVVNDLWLTGCVDSLRYINRGQPPRDSEHPYRKGIHTDGRVAVVEFNACRVPQEDFANLGPERQPALAVRIIRRGTLTTRNHFLRDNIVYRTADGTRIGVLAARRWYLNRRNERRAEEEDARRATPPATAVASAAAE